MSQPAVPYHDAPLARLSSLLRGAWLWLLLGFAAFGVLFRIEIATAIRTWTDSTAYNHCFLVIPIALWLIWDRRFSLRGSTATPTVWPALLILPLGAAWLLAERLGIMEGRQLTALTMLEVLFLALLGWRLWSALMGPLLYLYFLVPFGEFLTPKLQDITTWFTRHGLELLGIPAFIDGYVIDIPEGTFFVAEACAGLRFLIASIAFGTLYALMMYRSPVRRGIFIALSIGVPIVANGIRALGIVVLGHILGSAEAGAADHIIYGWLFFSAVILLLIVVGLPFRQDIAAPEPDMRTPAAEPAGGMAAGLLPGLAVAMLAALGPLAALWLNQAAAMPLAAALKPLDLSPACLDTGARIALAPSTTGRAIAQQVDCGGILLNVRIEVFSPRSTAGPVNAERRRLTRPTEAEDTAESPIAPAGDRLHTWLTAISSEPSLVGASALWIDGAPMLPSLAMRARMAKTSLFGGGFAPVLVAVVPAVDWARVGPMEKKRLADRIAQFLREAPRIDDQVRAIAAAAALGG